MDSADGNAAMARASDRELGLIDAWWRAANYLSVGQIYLCDNPLLAEPLSPAHIKRMLLGHWGTTPGQNFIYAHLNRIIRAYGLNMIYISGPGHGGPALVGNAYLEGTLQRDLSRDLRRRPRAAEAVHAVPPSPAVFRVTSRPNALVPFMRAESRATARKPRLRRGTDNLDLKVACVVGDGDSETGPLATAWHANKFLNLATDGVVLLILHLNGYKIANPTILARISRGELRQLLEGCGWAPILFVAGEEPHTMHRLMADALDTAIGRIREIHEDARVRGNRARPRWPMIVLDSPKGWTGPKEVDGQRIEGTFRAHQVPLTDPRTNPAHLRQLESWLRSYRPQELFDEQGRLRAQLRALAPAGCQRRMSANPHANGGALLQRSAAA